MYSVIFFGHCFDMSWLLGSDWGEIGGCQAKLFDFPLLPQRKKWSRHANLYVHLFARDITREVPPTKSVKMSTLYHIFLIDYCRDFTHILHICTRPQVDSLV